MPVAAKAVLAIGEVRRRVGVAVAKCAASDADVVIVSCRDIAVADSASIAASQIAEAVCRCGAAQPDVTVAYKKTIVGTHEAACGRCAVAHGD